MSDERLQAFKTYDPQIHKKITPSILRECVAEIERLRASLQEQVAYNKSGADWAFKEMADQKARIAELRASLQEKARVLGAQQARITELELGGINVGMAALEVGKAKIQELEARITELETALTSSNSPALCQCSQCRDIVAELSRLRGAK